LASSIGTAYDVNEVPAAFAGGHPETRLVRQQARRANESASHQGRKTAP